MAVGDDEAGRLEAAVARLEIELFAEVGDLLARAAELRETATTRGLTSLARRARLVEADVVARTTDALEAIRMESEVRDAALADGDTVALGRAHALLATALDDLGDRQSALAEAELAFTMLDETFPVHLQVDHTMVFALVTSLHRSAQISFGLFDRALEMASELDEPVLTVAVLNNLAWLLYEHEEMDRALACAARIRAIAAETGVPLSLSVVDTLGRLMAESGDAEGAVELLTEALSSAPDTDLSSVPAALQTLGIAWRRLGETDRAIELLERCRAKCVERHLRQKELEVLVDLAELYAEQGRFELAYRTQRTYHDLARQLRRQEDEAAAAAMQAMHETRLVRERNFELEQLARRDPLTGLRNRRYLADEMRQIVVDTRRAGLPLSVCLGDIDHFKAVNDQLSHQAGDIVLTAAAHLLDSVVTEPGFVVRFGGEEFLAVLPGVDLTGAAALAHSWCDLMRRHDWAEEGLGRTVTISVGVAEMRDREEVAELMAEADRCMYEAKRSGRDRVVVSERPH